MQSDVKTEQYEETLPTADVPYSSNRGTAIALVAALHAVCCGLPLLLLSGVSLAFLAPYWPMAAVLLAMLGGSGLIWYFKRGSSTCPRNEACSVFPKKLNDCQEGEIICKKSHSWVSRTAEPRLPVFLVTAGALAGGRRISVRTTQRGDSAHE